MPALLSKSLAPSRSTLSILSGLTVVGLAYLLLKYLRARRIQPDRVTTNPSDTKPAHRRPLVVFYASQKGNSKVL